ncbi:MAG: fumarylacetoacetate hydrolase family protein, partial [Actinomycetota bacterium]
PRHMRLFRYVSHRGGFQPRLAVAVDGGQPIDLIDAWRRETGTRLDWDESGFLVSFVSLIEDGPEVWSEVRGVVHAAGHDDEMKVGDQTPGLRWLCPLERMSSLRDFLAFEDHVKRGAARRNTSVPDYWYEAPVYYKGNHRAVIGPDEECRWPSYSNRLDFELELGMIVGKRGRNISATDAHRYVFGFTILNDFSARDVQSKEMSAWLGPAKGKDFCNALGPCIITADEVGAEPDLEMICRVNGEEWGRGRSSDAHWRWADMISHVSTGEDVWPGDVYGSGTPGGCCGLDNDRELDPGDVVELEIERIGILRNVIGPRPALTPA